MKDRSEISSNHDHDSTLAYTPFQFSRTLSLIIS